MRKYDTYNPYELARHLKIDVYEFRLPPDVRGFLIRPLRRKMIFINDNLTETEKAAKPVPVIFTNLAALFLSE